RDLVAGQCDVHGVLSVAVDDRGDLALGAQATGEALAEAGAKVCEDLVVVRHDVLLQTRGDGPRGGRWSRRLGTDSRTRDHGAHPTMGLHITASITDERARATSLAEELLHATRNPGRLVTCSMPPSS